MFWISHVGSEYQEPTLGPDPGQNPIRLRRKRKNSSSGQLQSGSLAFMGTETTGLDQCRRSEASLRLLERGNRQHERREAIRQFPPDRRPIFPQ